VQLVKLLSGFCRVNRTPHFVLHQQCPDFLTPLLALLSHIPRQFSGSNSWQLADTVFSMLKNLSAFNSTTQQKICNGILLFLQNNRND